MSLVDVEIRKLELKDLLTLCDILDANDSWKSLMKVIPENLEDKDCSRTKYTNQHIELIERTRDVQRKSCSALLFGEWGTSGRIRPCLSHLRSLLIKTNLFRAADFVCKLLNEPYPERPEAGPAALISIPNTNELTELERSLSADSPLKLSLLLQNENSHTLNTDILELDYPLFEQDIVNLPYIVLVKATNDFDEKNCLGSGSCGTVYLGIINSNCIKIAIKRFHMEDAPGGSHKQFDSEMLAMSKIRHPNLLPLLGFSDDSSILCLIYPFMPNGSLGEMLTTKENKTHLHWIRRLEIALGVAKGIEHLHNMNPPLIHRDIKAANVLLDDFMNPKLCDFGLIRRSPNNSSKILTTTVIGTTAYMAPETFKGYISVKMDIYSFGVVMLELLTGLPASMPELSTDETKFLVQEIYDMIDDDSFHIADSTAGDWGGNLIPKQFLDLAKVCISNEENKRPVIGNVVNEIEKLLNNQ